jgi:hypothetical protein
MSMSKKLQIRAETPLENVDLKALVTEIKGFLETCRLTADSDVYLKFHPKLAQVIDKL